jgi:alkylation response protein AidB-like acyl-CoA dehydrogenase
MPVWSEQDTMIADSTAAFFREAGEVGRVRALRGQHEGRDFWQRAAEQGWIGMLVSQSPGGSGLELRDALVVMRAAGRYLPPEPLAAAIALAQSMQNVPELSDTLAKAVAGELVVLPAFAAGSASERPLRTRPVSGLALAGALVVLDDRDGVFFAGAGKFSFETRPSLDGGSVGVAEIRDPVPLHWSADARRDLADTWLLLHAAELVGLGEEALARTLDYLETRKQFGVPLSSFQALQQRAANVHVALAAADALVFEAARAFGGPDQSFAGIASFKRAADAAEKAAKEAIQMHGAIGFTDECDIGLFLKRAVAICAIGRDLAAHRVSSQRTN